MQDKSQIRDQVSRILNYSLFQGSMILKDFLTFIVEETLVGSEEGLKEYVIATNVLKKDGDWKPVLAVLPCTILNYARAFPVALLRD